MVKRVVLDTNYFRALKEEDLAPVHALGFSISVGMSAFLETLAEAARESKPGKIIGPAKSLSRFIDQTYPIAPNAGDFLWRYSSSRGFGDQNKVHVRYLEQSFMNWWWLAVDTKLDVDPKQLRAMGLEADAYLRQRGESWQRSASRWPKEELTEFTMFSERKQRALFADAVRKQVARTGTRADLIRRQLHAYVWVAAWHLWQTAKGATTAAENDSEDILSLMHLAEPAFLLTHDEKLIQVVDACRTYQAPWVLSLSQFLAGRLPSGRPWGESARREADVFRRQPCTGPCRICRRVE